MNNLGFKMGISKEKYFAHEQEKKLLKQQLKLEQKRTQRAKETNNYKKESILVKTFFGITLSILVMIDILIQV